jgi:hypothetical protein
MSRSFTMRAAALAAAVALGSFALPSQAHSNPSSDLSAASGLSLSVPVAISVAAPAAVLVSGAAFTVVAVQALAEGTVWLLERASDGVRVSVRFGSEVASASVVVVGTALVVTTVAAGCVLSAAGEAIAFIPNELGRSLLHDERITR